MTARLNSKPEPKPRMTHYGHTFHESSTQALAQLLRKHSEGYHTDIKMTGRKIMVRYCKGSNGLLR